MSADPTGDSAQRWRSCRPVGADDHNRTVPQRLRFSLNSYTEILTELQHSAWNAHITFLSCTLERGLYRMTDGHCESCDMPN